MKPAPEPVITTWEQLPLVCGLEHVVKLYGRSEISIRKAIAKGVFPVAPFSMYPMRFSRAELQAHLEGGATRRPPIRLTSSRR